MNVLVTGGRGQLGRALARCGAAAGHHVTALDVDHLDIRDPSSIAAALEAHQPTVLINAAAYTAVDRAETEPDAAFAVNATGAAHLARACADRQVRMLQVSTDYVFDGASTHPYREDDPVAPLGVYGASKAAGELAVRLAGGAVVRTSWLFEAQGPSFVHTMLRLAADRPVLRVVADQHGCPTWADDLATALLSLAAQPTIADCYHYCNDEPTTWYGFATAIVDEARKHRTVMCERIEPITTAEYPTPARRPASSVLDTTRIRELGIVPRSWRTGLSAVVAQVLQ
ncbi:MAG: rfbD [Myxococcales bacterium]|nr:rfbD [Myxococcales bacterium]